MNLKIKKGDIFCTYNPIFFGRCINSIQRFYSCDDKSDYSHAGIILNEQGNTYEVSWITKEYNLYEHHKGNNLFIARYENLTDELFDNAVNTIRFLYGNQWYPFWRLFFFLVSPTSKYVSFGKVVCSEMVAHYLHLIGARHEHYCGTDVDKLYDELSNWRIYKTVFENKL